MSAGGFTPRHDADGGGGGRGMTYRGRGTSRVVELAASSLAIEVVSSQLALVGSSCVDDAECRSERSE
jgi:hypothetical protein